MEGRSGFPHLFWVKNLTFGIDFSDLNEYIFGNTTISKSILCSVSYWRDSLHNKMQILIDNHSVFFSFRHCNMSCRPFIDFETCCNPQTKVSSASCLYLMFRIRNSLFILQVLNLFSICIYGTSFRIHFVLQK